MQKQYVTVTLNRDELHTLLNLCAGRMLTIEEQNNGPDAEKEHKALNDLRTKLTTAWMDR